MWLYKLYFYVYFLSVIIPRCIGLKIFENSLNQNSYKKFYHRTAEFGPNPGGYNVSGSLELFDPLIACNINQYVNRTTQSNIHVDDNSDNGDNNADKITVYNQIYKNKIVLILRGNCTFIKKVSNAEILGAIGVVVGDHNTSEWIVMSQDPNKHFQDITIPSVFVPHNTYQWILKLLLSDINSDVFAMLDQDGEYIAPSGKFWLAAFGIVIIVIPTLWCFIVCMALLRKKAIIYIQRSRRRQYLTQIPIILYKGKNDEINLSIINSNNSNNSNNTTTVTDINKINKITEITEIDDEGGSFSSNFKNMSRLLLNSFRSKRELMNPLNDSCPICLEEFTQNEELRLLPCHHGYHIKTCIDPWLHKQSELCPMCKQSIFVNSNNNNNNNNNNICFNSILKICCINRNANINNNNNNNVNNNDNDGNNNNDIIILSNQDELVPIDSDSNNQQEDQEDQEDEQ